MVSINGIAYKLPCCQSFTTTKTQAPAVAQILKHKIDHTWNQFCVQIKAHINKPIEKQIQTEIAKADKIEATESKPLFISSLRRTFNSAMNAIKAANMDPIHLPKQVALQLAEILGRFGVAIYANKDVQDPFQSSLDVLKTALLMQQYALGLSSTCPDLSKLVIIDDLYTDPTVRNANVALADEAIDNLNANTWASKTLFLTEKQQLLIPNILRYSNGAMRYLEQGTLARSERLLETSEACLLAAQKKPSFNQVEVNHQLAELKYNDVTGFLAAKIEDFEARGETAQAEDTKKILTKLWDECITLSKDPEQMRARCDNKRTFIEDLTLEQEMDLRKSSLNRHLSLPKERQNIVLIALSHHNISHVYEKMGDLKKAIAHADEAVVAVIAARQKGENNVQFDSVEAHARNLVAKYA